MLKTIIPSMIIDNDIDHNRKEYSCIADFMIKNSEDNKAMKVSYVLQRKKRSLSG